MFRIYGVVLEVLESLQPALKRIEMKDRDLARQQRATTPGGDRPPSRSDAT